MAMHGRTTLGAPALLAAAVALLASAVTLTLLPSAAAQPWPTCDGTTGRYSAGDAYANNIQQLIQNLQLNAYRTPALFAKGSAGTGADAVYGLMLCRGDLSATDCFDCGTHAGQDVYRVCNGTRDAALVDNQCYVRLSPMDFLASTNNTGMVGLTGPTVPAGVDDLDAYVAAVTRLLNATVRYAVDRGSAPSSSSSSSSPGKYFATGHMVGVDPQLQLPDGIWSMAQCAGDISPVQCGSCLEDLMAQWWVAFDRRQVGARLDGSRCNLRIEGANFSGSPMVKMQMNGEVSAPAPAPSTDIAPGTTGGKNNSVRRLLGIILPILFAAIVASIALCIWIACKKRTSQGADLPHETYMAEGFESIKPILLPLSSLQVATNNFDESNKLGEGGFGAVYKGDLSGRKVAVKRLRNGSDQGLEELKNELVLVAKLHHKNLVQLEGFCLQEGERLLVYEYMPNKSLDNILFDHEEKGRLDWRKRFNIIKGVARGLQYLHEDSQNIVVHRDMKASNVLLDEDMSPKIGDFGLARLFGQDQTRDITNHIAGTFGYMPPEYVMCGQISPKSDVFSFGILVIEIVTGQRNTGHYFYDEQNEDIISLVWRHWTEGTIADMIDNSLGRNYSETEVLKCVNIGLLCLQHSPVDRPTMSDVMAMLNVDDASSLPPAGRPTFFVDRGTCYSYNSCTITHLSAR